MMNELDLEAIENDGCQETEASQLDDVLAGLVAVVKAVQRLERAVERLEARLAQNAPSTPIQQPEELAQIGGFARRKPSW
jgi:cell division septum initiation protein DivIVA